MFPFMRNESGFTTIVNGQSYTVCNSHPHYKVLVDAVKSDDVDMFLKNVSFVEAIKNHVGATVENGEVYFNGEPVNSVLADRIIEHIKEGIPPEPMLRFMEKLFQNPSKQSIDELYDFLSHENLPITEDGNFQAYKTVDENYWSKRGGKIRLIRGTVDAKGRVYNGIGEEIECTRNSVDDNRENTCSDGLHIGALGYAGPGGSYNKSGDKVIIVEVNPADVVSVPKDYNAQKCRVCHYVVKGDYTGKLPSTLAGRPDLEKEEVYNDYVDYLSDHWEGDDGWDDQENDDWVDEVEKDYKLGLTSINVTPEQVRVLDVVDFDYKGKRRSLSVDESSDDKFVRGYLLKGDPSFRTEINVSNFRCFTRSLMTNVEVFVNN